MSTTKTSRQLAAEIAAFEVGRLDCLDRMLLEPEVHTGYKKVFTAVCEEKKSIFGEWQSDARASLEQDFAAEAGYLIGLEVGKRLAGGAK